MIDAWLDLVLGSRCSGCERPGRALCPGCEATLPTRAVLSWPTPTPPGLVPPWSTGEYAGTLRSLVVDHKEHGRLALARPLGRLLAVAVLGAWAAEQGSSRGAGPGVQLVPVPSHPAVVRGRGQDPLLRVTHRAAAELRRRGVPVAVVKALQVAARPDDQALLGADDRARNVAGRFRVRSPAARRAGPIVLVDDVVTTGSTLREAQRALEAGGVRPVAAAVVAATRRRSIGRGEPASSLPIRPAGG